MRNLKHILNVIGVRFVELMGAVLSDKLYLKWKWRFKMGGKLDLDNPKTFNEKLQWLKLYDRMPEYTTMVDKAKVKDYVAKKIGEEYLIPTIGVWDVPEDIDFNSLPNQFVLKCNHNSGGLFICKDKTKVTKKQWVAVLKGLRKSLDYNYYMLGREWPYKNVEPKLIAEDFLESDSSRDLLDYKFMCFNGNVKCVFVCSRRGTKDGLRVTFFDLDWNLLPFTRSHPAEDSPIPKPQSLKLMVELATKLSMGIPFVRVDFYEKDGKVYFGEMTFFPGNGYEAFEPEEWDYKLGEWIKLPNK